MFIVNDMPLQISKIVLERLAKVEPATVGHFYHTGFMAPKLRAVIPDRRVAGTAVTARVPGMDGTVLHNVISMARPGDFLVIDRCGDVRHACFGGVTVVAAKAAGIVGVVIDGMATDFAEIRREDLPVWCLGPSPITVKRYGIDGQINIPVSCGGVSVKPGDAILGDETGLLVLDPSEVEAVIEKALGIQEREITILKRLRAGEKLADITGARKQLEDAMAAQLQ